MSNLLVKRRDANTSEASSDGAMTEIYTDTNGNIKVNAVVGTITVGGFTTIGTFIKNVTTAGTAVQVSATSVSTSKVVLNARLGNTSPVVVGDSNVVAANATQRGIVLVPGNDPITIEISNLNKLYVDSQTNGDGVCGAYFV